MQVEELSREQLLAEVQKLRQELIDLHNEKADLEILLENTTEHADIVEAELQNKATELEATNTALQQLDQLKDEFLANTSHELRTPLNGIIGIAESLIDGATGSLPEETIINLNMIVSSGRRLAALVNDILDFAKLKHQKLELQIKPVGMREITNIVMMVCQPLIGSKHLQLINNISPNLPPVDADENRVQQILYNLIGNAIKFTSSGVVEVTAKEVIVETPIASSKKQLFKSYLAITITDRGIGIPSYKLDRIFESFEQVDGSTARQYGGTGLGLAITKKLVELHGGQITVESILGAGSQFTFTMPVSQTQEFIHSPKLSVDLAHSVVSLNNQFNSVKNKNLTSLEENLSNYKDIDLANLNISDAFEKISFNSAREKEQLKILIVDDEPINLQVLINNLSIANYHVIPANNGIEALQIMANGDKPDLIILDVMMPYMNGYEVCQKIRQYFPAHQLPILMLTAKNQIADLLAGLKAGANDYLSKPITKSELIARIKTHIQLAKINTAYSRFVPRQFLEILNKESITDVNLGDQVQKEMSVLFADIRNFTNLSEKMTPEDNFKFINAYLSRMEPAITQNYGFIDKYIGDAIMALFSGGADNAVKAAISMLQRLTGYNTTRQRPERPPLEIGIGINTGSLILGTVGGRDRMDSTVISDAVNLAARLEAMTKVYGVSLLITHNTFFQLDKPEDFNLRIIERTLVKGKSQPVSIFEVFDADPPKMRELKLATKETFEKAILLFNSKRLLESRQLFQKCLEKNPTDKVSQIYLERCQIIN